MQTQCADVQLKVNEYFESSSGYWKEIYFDNRLLPTIYQDRHNVTLGWIRELSLPAHARILEAGCGAGLLTVALARNGQTVDAMDSTAAMLRTARKEAADNGVQDQVRFHVGDVHKLPFDAQTFDLIEWVQGTAAVPYLEKGPLTKLADPHMATRLNKAFGGPFNFIGFGFWFN